MQFTDIYALDKSSRMTDDGYLVTSVKAARTGIQDYRGDEVGKPGKDVVRIYRPEEEVFSAASMGSYSYHPMTDDHPDEMVDADNWREYAVGFVGGDVARDGDYIRVPLAVMDAATRDRINDGKRELSMGYTSDLDWTPGKTEAGEQYDAVQRNIRINHVALVDKGRAGPQARIGDKGGQNETAQSQPDGGHKMATQKVKIGDVSIEVDEQAAEVINTLSEKLKTAEAQAEQASQQADADKAEADKAMAAKDAEIDKLKASVKDAAALDEEINARVKLIADAKRVADVDYSGKSPDAIRKTAVEAHGVDVADKSDAYIEARFDALLDSAVTETKDSKTTNIGDARQRYLDRLTRKEANHG